MKYRLYKSDRISSNAIYQILLNRGIENPELYLSLNSSTEDNLIDVINSYHNLDNISDAVKLFNKHYENKDVIGILVDTDPDGYTSAASMYNYIKKMDENYPIEYIMHIESKSHGLNGIGKDVDIPESIKLLIVPDAGTNDVNECAKLNETMDIIILDHHELEEINVPMVEKNSNISSNGYRTILVNNQTSGNYTNKDLSGVGIVYRFLQALDEELWNDFADDYLDLVALGNISDVMDMRSYETRYFVNKGLQNINNNFFNSMIKAQDFSMKGKINIHNVQWYITPVINALIRVGSLEEKELMFKAFIEQEEYFEYKKRATKDKPAETIQESIYDRAARLAKNAKSRQDKLRDKYVKELVEVIDNEISAKDKVVMIDVSDILTEKSLTGALAIKIAEKYNRPCMLLKRYINNGKMMFGGSARNINNSPIESLKDVVNATGIFSLQGHANAAGILMDADKVEDAKKALNEALKDIVYDSTYYVDYILDIDELDYNLPIEMSVFDSIVGQGISEPLVAIENVTINREDTEILGKTSNTIKFAINGIEYVQFFCKEGMPLYDWVNEAWAETDRLDCTIVGQPGVNDFNNVRTPQIVITDIDIIKKYNSDGNESDEDDDDFVW